MIDVYSAEKKNGIKDDILIHEWSVDEHREPFVIFNNENKNTENKNTENKNIEKVVKSGKKSLKRRQKKSKKSKKNTRKLFGK